MAGRAFPHYVRNLAQVTEAAQHQERPDLQAEPALAIPFVARELQPLDSGGQLL